MLRVTKQEEREEGAQTVQSGGAVNSVNKSIYLISPRHLGKLRLTLISPAFERVAGKLRWPRDMWALMLQSNLVGKAQDICAAMPIEDSLNYDLVKTAVLRAYELVPEAYRQKC